MNDINNVVVTTAISRIRDLQSFDRTNLYLSNYYRHTDLFNTFYKDLSSEANLIFNKYSEDELKVAFSFVDMYK